jgi:phage tail sheath protein FI
MPNFVSPGAYVIEKDISDYPPTINSSVVGIVGFASRGPIAGVNGEKATLITSPQQLIDTFGEPSEEIKGQALEGALEILEATNSMRFIRCASEALTASAAVAIGSCPAIRVGVTNGDPVEGGMSAIGSLDAETSTVRLTVSVRDNNGNIIVDKAYIIPPGTINATAAQGATTLQALTKVIGGSLDADRLLVTSSTGTNLGVTALGDEVQPVLAGAAAGTGASLYVKMELLQDDDTWTSCGNSLGVLTEKSLVTETGCTKTAIGYTLDTNKVSYLAESLWPGAGYNAGTTPGGTTSGVSFEVGVNGGVTTLETINNLGVAAESAKAGMVSGSFLTDTIGETYAARTSNYITARFVMDTDGVVGTIPTTTLDATPLVSFQGRFSTMSGDQVTTTLSDGSIVAADPRFLKLVQGTYNLGGGANGIPTLAVDVATAVVGAVEADGGKTGMEALDDPVLNISVALAPGPGVGDSETIQNGLVTVAERTTDFLALLSPPYAIGTPGDAISWSNGQSESRSSSLNSSYAALYWPWLKVFQVFDAKDRWLAPEIYGARQIGVTDAVADPWFAPAGFVRGRLTKPTDVEVILNQGDRDSMYSGGNVLNPIVNFPQNGIAIFGQRTTQRAPTALDRINVRRMMIYIKKQILASTQRLIFEPNDKFTWTRVEELLNPMLDDILRRRGITQFAVVCDETTNTPVRVDRNEMWCKVIIKPTKTAEMVIFELNLTNQSAQMG